MNDDIRALTKESKQSTDSSKVILLLALSSFCMGVTEFIVAGILPDIARYFQITQPQAGWLVTIYAIGVVLGAPLLNIPFSYTDRRKQLLINLFIFMVANLTLVLSNFFPLTLFARFIAGCMHGVFFVNATLATMIIAPKGKENQSLALMASGLTIALVSGVPLGTFIGHSFGFKSVFLLICFLSLIAFIGVFFLMPHHIPSIPAKPRDLIKSLKLRPMIKVYMVTAGTCGAAFVLYTYMAKFLLENAHFSQDSIGFLFLVYGFSAIFGNLFGGKLTDSKGCIMALRIILGGQVIFYTLMAFSLYYKPLLCINLFLMGFVAFAGIAPLKSLSMMSARKYAADFNEAAVSVNEAAFNVGIALASFIGGIVVTFLGVGANPFFAALFALPIFILVLKSQRAI